MGSVWVSTDRSEEQPAKAGDEKKTDKEREVEIGTGVGRKYLEAWQHNDQRPDGGSEIRGTRHRFSERYSGGGGRRGGYPTELD